MKFLTVLVMSVFSIAAFSADVDMKKSQFTWLGKKVTGQHTGLISLKSAKVDLTKKGTVKKGEFVMDINSITVTDLKGEWATKLLKHLKSDDFFETSKHPTAKLEITGDDGKAVKGKLTIKGKTHPVNVEYKKDGKKYVGTMKFDRTKFGMVYKSGNFFKDLGDKAIYDEVAVNFAIVVK